MCLVLLPEFPDAAGQPREQTSFSAEASAVEHPVPPPQGAFDVLLKDPDIALLNRSRHPEDGSPSEWFSASEIQLNGRGPRELVVMGRGPVRGANVTTFWVMEQAKASYRVLLTVTAHDLNVKATTRQRYRDIEVLSATATTVARTIFRFDGAKYVQTSFTRTANR